jgi:hypothetical protein
LAFVALPDSCGYRQNGAALTLLSLARGDLVAEIKGRGWQLLARSLDETRIDPKSRTSFLAERARPRCPDGFNSEQLLGHPVFRQRARRRPPANVDIFDAHAREHILGEVDNRASQCLGPASSRAPLRRQPPSRTQRHGWPSPSAVLRPGRHGALKFRTALSV